MVVVVFGISESKEALWTIKCTCSLKSHQINYTGRGALAEFDFSKVQWGLRRRLGGGDHRKLRQWGSGHGPSHNGILHTMLSVIVSSGTC